MGRGRVAVDGLMRVGVVFPGQGSQMVGMGVDVARKAPAAADLFARAERVLGYDLLALVENGPEERLRETRYAQPAIFVTNCAAAAAIGDALSPVVSAGHSFGEYCSLELAGALTFEEALTLLHARATAMQDAAELAPGGMSAVLGLDAALVREAALAAREQTGLRVQLANFNQPGQIVISGDLEAVRRAGELALAAGAKRVIALNVSGAWHSELMDPARAAFAPAVRRAKIELPRFAVISNVDAKPYADTATIAEHLIASVTSEVLWHETALRLLEERLDLVIECGASAVLTPMMKRMTGVPELLHVGDAKGAEKARALLTSATAHAP